MSLCYNDCIRKSIVKFSTSLSKRSINGRINHKVVRYNSAFVPSESDISQHLRKWNDNLFDGGSRYKNRKQIKKPSCETCIFFSPSKHQEHDPDNPSMFIGRCEEITSFLGMNAIRRNQGMRCHGSLYEEN